MNALICPISKEKVNENVVRLTGFFVATIVLLFNITGNIYLMLFLLIDFSIRAFTPIKSSPLSFISKSSQKRLNLSPVMIDKAPKLFAARVGFVFSILTLSLFPISPIGASIVSLILLTCALMESLFNFCVGCVVYTYLVLPFK